VCAFWMVGSIFTATLAWVMLGLIGAPWRLFAALCAGPSTACFISAFLYLPESPRWLLQKGRVDECKAAMVHIAGERGMHMVMNCNLVTEKAEGKPEDSAEPEGHSSASHVLKLFSPRLRFTTAMLAVMVCSINFGWYGLVLWMPSLFEKVGYSQGSVYSSALLVAFANLPGNVVSILVVDRPEVGRKRLYVGSMLAAAALAVIFGCSSTKVLVVAAAMGYNAVSVGAWNSLECMLAESYPTEVRSVASGVLHSGGRVASLLAQLIDGFMLEQGVFTLLMVNAGTMLVGCIAGMRLPFDPVGQRQKSTSEESRSNPLPAMKS